MIDEMNSLLFKTQFLGQKFILVDEFSKLWGEMRKK
jgi:hypothetical protein